MPESRATPRIPKQKRSEATRQKLIEAGTKSFCESGYHGTSSKKIARRAGISIGSFYNYFKDKKQLLMEIYFGHASQVHETVAQALRQADFAAQTIDGRTTVKTIIDQSLALHDFSPDLHREITALMYSDPDFAEVGLRMNDAMVQVMVHILSPHQQALRVDDLEAAARVVVHAVEEVIHSVKMFEPPIEANRLTDALADMVYRFLYKDA